MKLNLWMESHNPSFDMAAAKKQASDFGYLASATNFWNILPTFDLAQSHIFF
jgi:hypothetical protein